MARSDSGAPDRSRLEVFQHLFAAVAEEMGERLKRSAFSVNIKERQDYSCALFDDDGQMIGQAAHLPVHLGAAPMSVAAARARVDMGPGDAVLLNDPFEGGTHLPDLTLVAPVFLKDEGTGAPQAAASFFVANRAHHADVGGAHPGSMAPARDVHGEGLRIPPLLLIKNGELDRDVLRLLLANMRVPREREGDLLAQWAAVRVGVLRLTAMAGEYGQSELRARGAQLMDWTCNLTRELTDSMPAGSWTFEDSLEPHGKQRSAVIRLTLTKSGGRLCFDFRASSDQQPGSINAPRAVAIAAVVYSLRQLLPAGTPTNAGLSREVEILTRPGSLVDASYPAPVAAGNVETSQRIVDVVAGALAQVFPKRIPAASAGTMSNLSFGGGDGPGDEAFAYYETLPGGAGGGPAGAGAHALQTHMTNTRNTPIEALERELPVRVLRFTVRRGSGGRGRARGGDGIVRRLRFLVPVRVGFVAERTRLGPWGLAGGGRGRAGGLRVRLPGKTRDSRAPGKCTLDLPAGAEVEVGTPGGGAFGR
ncbi:MAG: hydantoinase B/oxoprolinase family protein [bacterium]|jgi:N-methylhydantoinase B|nr:hydantoinase B/oxoprolinase family protein [Planctomycetota bacterium]HIL51997.1 hydantoinase B/oxoprolinase family protein [Planctomycetota bacterium]